jgi:hypothetical protein
MAAAMSAVSSALRVSEAAGKGSGKTNVIDGHRAKRNHVDTKCVQVFKGLPA